MTLAVALSVGLVLAAVGIFGVFLYKRKVNRKQTASGTPFYFYFFSNFTGHQRHSQFFVTRDPIWIAHEYRGECLVSHC